MLCVVIVTLCYVFKIERGMNALHYNIRIMFMMCAAVYINCHLHDEDLFFMSEASMPWHGEVFHKRDEWEGTLCQIPPTSLKAIVRKGMLHNVFKSPLKALHAQRKALRQCYIVNYDRNNATWHNLELHVLNFGPSVNT